MTGRLTLSTGYRDIERRHDRVVRSGARGRRWSGPSSSNGFDRPFTGRFRTVSDPETV